MQKKIKLSHEEKRLIRTLLIFLLFQTLIIGLFVESYLHSKPIRIEDTQKADIIIEDMDILTYGINSLCVISDSNDYIFSLERSRKLPELLSIGDRLTVRYYEGRHLVRGNVRFVVGARSETETYQTLEAYNEAKKGMSIFLAIAFPIAESILGGIVWFWIYLNANVINGLWRKIKRCCQKQEQERQGTVCVNTNEKLQ